MIFRTFDGKLIEINRYEFKNDTLYYKEIMKCKIGNKLSKSNNSSNNGCSTFVIQSLIQEVAL
jgi:hypothetical protein